MEETTVAVVATVTDQDIIEDPITGGLRPGWQIETLEQLDWALSRIADLEEERAENQRILQAAIDRLTVKQERLDAKIERGLLFFNFEVEHYVTMNRDTILKGGKAKSRGFLHGRIAWRKVGGGLVINNKEALLAWAKEQAIELEFVRIKQEPDVAAIKQWFKKTGEIPPGTDELPVREQLHITTDTKGEE